MIKIVDAMMGSGKSSAAITYMNEHPDQRYLYITPYIDETQRIVDACPEVGFVIPDIRDYKGNFTKTGHFKRLVKAGTSVALTHALFARCDEELSRAIADAGYVIIVDEVIDVF